MKRFSAVLLGLCIAALGLASEEWVGIYLSGKKIGYSHTETLNKGLNGRLGSHTVSYSIIKVGVLGQQLVMETEGKTWFDPEGNVLRIVYRIESGGRVSDVIAVVDGDSLHVTSKMAGNTVKKTLEIPDGKRMVADPTMDFIDPSSMKKKIEFVTFDPNFLALVEGSVRYGGREKTTVWDIEVDAHVLIIDDPRAVMKVYISAKGDMIKATGPLGMELLPETKESAMNLDATDDGPDIAFSTSTRPDKEIKNYRTSTLLKMRVTGTDIGHIPSGGHQSVKKDGDGWTLTVHPIQPDSSKAVTINEAARKQMRWTKPDSRIESESPTFVILADKIVGEETNVIKAAEKVRKYVYSIIKANAGIGLIRDSSEILATKEGVCRDHAILSAAIMRAAGIPTRMVSGMVYAQGQFFYHAWVEVFDGERWIGFDSTRPESRLSATHIKTGQGTIKQAYTSFLLDGVEFKVLEVRS